MPTGVDFGTVTRHRSWVDDTSSGSIANGHVVQNEPYSSPEPFKEISTGSPAEKPRGDIAAKAGAANESERANDRIRQQSAVCLRIVALHPIPNSAPPRLCVFALKRLPPRPRRKTQRRKDAEAQREITRSLP